MSQVTDEDLNLKILYIENEEVQDPILKYIKSKYGEESVGVRSLDSGSEELEKAADEGKPFDFAIHDCGIFVNDEHEIESALAGDNLYQQLIDHEVPVFILSGYEQLDEPYLSDPPVLGYETKPTEESKIDLSVQRFLEYREREMQTQ